MIKHLIGGHNMRMKIEVQNYRGQKIKEQKLQLNTERAKTTQCLKHLLLLLIMMIKKLQHCLRTFKEWNNKNLILQNIHALRMTESTVMYGLLYVKVKVIVSILLFKLTSDKSVAYVP